MSVTAVVALLVALVFLVFLNRVLDAGHSWNDRSSSTARIDVAGEILAAPDEEAHRHLRIVHLQDGDSGIVQPTTVPIVLDDGPWFILRRGTVAFVNPAALAAMTMLRGSELPAGFQFVAPRVTATSTTASL